MDYITETQTFSIFNRREHNESLLEYYQEESMFMLKILEGYDITMEAAEDKKNIVRKTFTRIIEFIKRITAAFISKAKQLFGSRAEWLKNNAKHLATVNLDNVVIEVLPQWMGKLNDGLAIIKKNDPMTALERMRNDPKSNASEGAKKKLFSAYLNKEGDLAGGLKAHFRYGKANADPAPVKLSGNQLRVTMINTMLPYCNEYLNGFVKQTSAAEKALQSQVQRVQSHLTRAENAQSVGESFIMIENMRLDQVVPGIALMEAETKAAPTPSKAVVHSKNEDQTRQENEKLSGMSVNSLKYARELLQCNQLVYAAMLTVGEEKFNLYFSVMKSAIGKGSFKKKDKQKVKKEK